MVKINLNSMSEEDKLILKEKVISLHEQGIDNKEISKLTDLDRRQVSRIIISYVNNGLDAISNQKKGRKSTIKLYEADVLEKLSKNELFLTTEDITKVFSSVTDTNITPQSIRNILKHFTANATEAIKYDDANSAWRQYHDHPTDKDFDVTAFIKYIIPHIMYYILVIKRNNYLIPLSLHDIDMNEPQYENPLLKIITKIEKDFAITMQKYQDAPVTALDLVLLISSEPPTDDNPGNNIFSFSLYCELISVIRRAIDDSKDFIRAYLPAHWLAQMMVEFTLNNSPTPPYNFLKYIVSDKPAVDLYDYSSHEERTFKKRSPEYKQLLRDLEFFEKCDMIKHKPQYELIDNGNEVIYKLDLTMYRKNDPYSKEENEHPYYPERQHILSFDIYHHSHFPYFLIVIKGHKPYLHFFLKDITESSFLDVLIAFERTAEEIFDTDMTDSHICYEETVYFVIKELRIIELIRTSQTIQEHLQHMEENKKFFLMPMISKQCTNDLAPFIDLSDRT